MAINNVENPNRYNSTIVQSLRELAKLDSIPDDVITKAIQIANFLNENNKQIVKTVDGIVKKKEYNDKNVTWYKKYFSELPRLLSSNAFLILELMCNLMAQGNLVQISWQNIIDGTGIKNKKSIQNAIDELLKNACIAIKFPSDKRNAAVYMINPEIATVGKNHGKFWELVNHDKFEKWCAMKHDITYSRDVVKRTDKDNKYKVTFGRMGPPPEEAEENTTAPRGNANASNITVSAATQNTDMPDAFTRQAEPISDKDCEELPFNIHNYEQYIANEGA